MTRFSRSLCILCLLILLSLLLVGCGSGQSSVVGSGSSTRTLSSIAVTPPNHSIANATTQQFTATGTYSDNTTQDLTTSVTWASSDTSKATISNAGGSNGKATAVAAGTTTIKATLGTVSGTTTLTVTAATLQSIAVTPTNPSIALGTPQQFTATGTYSDNTTQNLTASVTWDSSDTSKATISNAGGSNGKATPVAAGTTTIKATLGTVSGTTTLTVTTAQPPQYEFFDDFTYSSPTDTALTTFGWSPRTGTGAPGVMTWKSSNITFSNDGIMTLTGHITSTSGSGTADGAELDWDQYKMLYGTYAARVRYVDTPDAGGCATVNEAPFWAMSDWNTTHGKDTYSEVDFEYLPCGGWGLPGPVQTFTTWLNDSTSNGSIEKDMPGSWDGWHTVIFVVQAGQPVKWYDNNTLVSTANDAAYTPRSPMQIIPQIWFIDNTVISTWHTDIDWVYYVKDTVMTGDQVTAAVNNLRNLGLARKNNLP